jgi:putative sigma-54 modulation protein
MNLTISGHHFVVPTYLRSYVEAKIPRIDQHFDRVVSIGVIFTPKDKNISSKVVVTVSVPGKLIVGECTAGSMQEAFDLVLDKLNRQVSERKQRQKCHRCAHHAHPKRAHSHGMLIAA